jgi:hypothetical protein
MYLTSADLIDMTVKHLQLLAGIFAEDADVLVARRDAADRDARCCKEASDAIQALIPKLIAARSTQQPTDKQLPLPGCANDDEL